MNIIESLYLCYRRLARIRSIFRDPRYQQPDHALVSKLSNEEINGALLNVLVRVKSKTFFCVQLRVDDNENQQRYYVGINRRYENISVAYIHVTPMQRPLLAYLWTEGLKIKDLNLEVIRQALLGADEVNLPMLTPLCHLPVRFYDPTASHDGNNDKASLCDASDLPWELSRCANTAAEPCHDNSLAASGKRISRKGASPCKRSRDGTSPEAESGSKEHKETNSDWSSLPREVRDGTEEGHGSLLFLEEMLS